MEIHYALCTGYQYRCLRTSQPEWRFGITHRECLVRSVYVTVDFRWRPLLRDPADEMILEAAINGRADALVTFNRRHFEPGVAQFDIDLLNPAEALGRMPP